MFPDAIGLLEGRCLIQVSDEVYVRGSPVEQMHHEPLGLSAECLDVMGRLPR